MLLSRKASQNLHLCLGKSLLANKNKTGQRVVLRTVARYTESSVRLRAAARGILQVTKHSGPWQLWPWCCCQLLLTVLLFAVAVTVQSWISHVFSNFWRSGFGLAQFWFGFSRSARVSGARVTWFFLPDSLRVEDFLHQDAEFHKFTIFSGMQLRTESAASGSFTWKVVPPQKVQGSIFFLFGHDYRLFCLAWQKARSDTTWQFFRWWRKCYEDDFDWQR